MLDVGLQPLFTLNPATQVLYAVLISASEVHAERLTGEPQETLSGNPNPTPATSNVDEHDIPNGVQPSVARRSNERLTVEPQL